MSKKAIYLLGILATILLGTWIYTTYCCNCTSEETLNTVLKTNAELKAKPEIKRINSYFNFKKSDFNVIPPISDSIAIFIAKLKSDLDNSTDDKFKITGIYSTKEENNSIFQDLGVTRANNVKNYLTDKGVSEKNNSFKCA